MLRETVKFVLVVMHFGIVLGITTVETIHLMIQEYGHLLLLQLDYLIFLDTDIYLIYTGKVIQYIYSSVSFDLFRSLLNYSTRVQVASSTNCVISVAAATYSR